MNPYSCSLRQIKQVDEDIVTYLSSIGEIFTVFDQQDSGCISYGVRASGEQWFVKHAENGEAIGFMKNAVAIHRDVSHPQLSKLLNAFTTAHGFALVYAWVDGEVLGTPKFQGREGRRHPAFGSGSCQ